jgi:CRP-like cAMP-binding protein
MLATTTTIPQSTVKNRILASLPDEEFRAISPLLRPVSLTSGVTLHEAGSEGPYLYFVEDGLISLLSVLEDGTSIEVTAVGREGVCDVAVLFGSNTTSHQALVQINGQALRMRTAAAREAFASRDKFRQCLLRFARMLLALTSQTAACNAVHTIEERLARWLLMTQERVNSGVLPLTHEFLSQMLGVRRSGVTVAAGTLQKAGLIRYNRKDIVILDRERLRAASCGCYKNMRQEFARYLEG